MGTPPRHTTLTQPVLAHSPPGSTPQPSVCPDCGGELVTARSQRTAETVCQACGLIVTDEAIDYGPDWRRYHNESGQSDPRHTAPLTQSRPDTGLGTQPPQFESHSSLQTESSSSSSQPQTPQELAHRNQVARSQSSQSRADTYTTVEISRLGAALELPQSAVTDAQTAFRDWHQTTALNGYNLDVLAPASLLYAVRTHRCGVTADDLLAVTRTAEDSSLSASLLRDRAHTLADQIGVAVPPPSYHPRLNRITTRLKPTPPWSLIKQAHDILDDLLHLSRSPSALAAYALSEAARASTQNSPPHLQPVAIADAAGVNLRTLQSLRQTIDEHTNSH
jgi:transcription initiation factor TFIIB